MEEQMLRTLRGVADLVQEAVEGMVREIAVAHEEIAGVPYAVLSQIPGVAVPARGIEVVQQGITTGVYRSILSINRIVWQCRRPATDQFR